MICPKCGVAIDGDVSFCSNCGADLAAAKESAAPIFADQTPSAVQPAGDQTQSAQPAGDYTQPAQPVGSYAQPTQPAGSYAQLTQSAQPTQSALPNQSTQPAGGYAQPGQPAGGYAQPAQPGQPAGGYNQPGQAAPVQSGEYTGKGTPAMILGVLSIVLAGVLGLVLGIIAIFQGKNALAADPNDVRAKVGRITGIIGLSISALLTIALIAVLVFGVFAARDPEVQQAFQDAVQIEATTSNDASTSASTDGAAVNPQDTTSSAAADATSQQQASQATETWAPECLDANNLPTIYALLDLQGFQLETLLQQLGWRYSSEENAWLGPGGAGLAVLNADGTPMGETEIGGLDKGAAGTPAIYVLIQPGYANVNDALAATKATNDDTFIADDSSAMAVVHGPNEIAHFAILSAAENEASWLIYTEEAIANGAIKATVGDIDGASIADLWRTVTGRNIGEAEAQPAAA